MKGPRSISIIFCTFYLQKLKTTMGSVFKISLRSIELSPPVPIIIIITIIRLFQAEFKTVHMKKKLTEKLIWVPDLNDR